MPALHRMVQLLVKFSREERIAKMDRGMDVICFKVRELGGC